MHMLYKSPGRALQGLRGINTGPLWKKVVHYEKYGGKFYHVYFSVASFVFDLKIVIFFSLDNSGFSENWD